MVIRWQKDERTMLSSPPKGANRGQHVNVNKCAVVEGRAVWIVDSIERDVALG